MLLLFSGSNIIVGGAPPPTGIAVSLAPPLRR